MSKIILASELEGRSLSELWSLYATVERELTQSALGSAQRRNALASLENIRRAINASGLHSNGPVPGP